MLNDASFCYFWFLEQLTLLKKQSNPSKTKVATLETNLSFFKEIKKLLNSHKLSPRGVMKQANLGIISSPTGKVSYVVEDAVTFKKEII